MTVVEYMEGARGGRGGSRGNAARHGGSRSAPERARMERVRICERVSVDPDFVKLRRRFGFQAGVLVSVFLLSYLAYLLLSAYAHDFMSARITDSVNVALAMGIGQFLLTFVLAWAFGRLSTHSLDPLAQRVRERARDEETADGGAVRR